MGGAGGDGWEGESGSSSKWTETGEAAESHGDSQLALGRWSGWRTGQSSAQRLMNTDHECSGTGCRLPGENRRKNKELPTSRGLARGRKQAQEAGRLAYCSTTGDNTKGSRS